MSISRQRCHHHANTPFNATTAVMSCEVSHHVLISGHSTIALVDCRFLLLSSTPMTYQHHLLHSASVAVAVVHHNCLHSSFVAVIAACHMLIT